jgi:cysteine desulfurase
MQINYFDNASTTKVESRILEVMLPYFNEIYGNASSNHDFGKESKQAIVLFRKHVSGLNVIKTKQLFTNVKVYKFLICYPEHQ